MIAIIKLLAVVMAGLGLTIVVSPNVTRKIFDFMSQGKRIYYAGFLRLFVGILLLLSSSKSAIPMAAAALGVLFLTSGIIIFAVDIEKVKGFMEHYAGMPALAVRLLGLVAVSFGLLTFSLF